MRRGAEGLIWVSRGVEALRSGALELETAKGYAMNTLMLTEEQSRLVRQSVVQMAVVDSHGEFLGYFDLPYTPERVAELKRRAKEGPFLSSAEIFAHLEMIENQEGGIGGGQSSAKPLLGAA